MAEPPNRDPRNDDALATRVLGRGVRAGQAIAGATGVDRALDVAAEEAIVRALESPAVERAIIRLAEEGRLEEVLERAAASLDVEELVGRAIESDAADRIWADILASDKAQMLVQRVAEAPEVRAAIAQQGLGLVSDIGHQISRLTERLDDLLEQAADKVGLSANHDAEAEEAGLVTRLVAFAIDAALTVGLLSIGFTVIASIIPFAFGDGEGLPLWGAIVLAGIALFIGGTLFQTFWYLVGQTPGMRFLGIRLVRDGGGDVDYKTATRRVLLLPLSILVFGLGILAILRSPKRQAWHDRGAHTVVIYDEASAPWSGIEGGRQQLRDRRRRHRAARAGGDTAA